MQPAVKLKPVVLTKPKAYQPILSAIERKAYRAAYRIMTEQTADVELVCPGARRSAQLDALARIIKEELR